MKTNFEIDKAEPQEGDVLLPIMSLMLILIPVLVGNMAFYHLHSIRVNTPAADSGESAPPPKPKKSEQKVMAKLQVDSEIFTLELIDEDTGNILINRPIRRGKHGIIDLRDELITMSKEYNKLDILLLSSYSGLKYEQLLTILDEGIKSIMNEKTNKPAIKVVIVPEEV